MIGFGFAENWGNQNLEVIRQCLPFTSPFNLIGTPSLSLPMGLDRRGLPACMQFIGNYLSEKQLHQVGYACENINPFRFRLG
ncbi:MAG TPA: amidase family protein [Virgibacillus sp.]|nr:amidase family protein [Virgibacillus sp.]HLR68733.1 amidase family protein [Virgibacillus sp.]